MKGALAQIKDGLPGCGPAMRLCEQMIELHLSQQDESLILEQMIRLRPIKRVELAVGGGASMTVGLEKDILAI